MTNSIPLSSLESAMLNKPRFTLEEKSEAEVLEEAGHNHGPARQCSRQYPHPSHDFTSFDFGPAKCEGIKV